MYQCRFVNVPGWSGEEQMFQNTPANVLGLTEECPSDGPGNVPGWNGKCPGPRGGAANFLDDPRKCLVLTGE